jgi:hypothetical protein
VVAALSNPPKTINQTDNPQPSQKIIESIGSPRYVFVVKDIENNIEYVLVENGTVVSISPKPKKEEK